MGHTNDVLSVSFSADNRQIVSGSRDKTIKLWNTLGDCKFTIQEKVHTDWVSCVRFSPNPQNPVIVSAGWDKLVKVRTMAEDGGVVDNVRGCFAIYKYLLLQSLRTMRQTITNALMTIEDNFLRTETCLHEISLTTRYHRSGNLPPAESKPTTSDTSATSIPSPFLPTAPSVRPAAKTAPPCFGT